MKLKVTQPLQPPWPQMAVIPTFPLAMNINFTSSGGNYESAGISGRKKSTDGRRNMMTDEDDLRFQPILKKVKSGDYLETRVSQESDSSLMGKLRPLPFL